MKSLFNKFQQIAQISGYSHAPPKKMYLDMYFILLQKLDFTPFTKKKTSRKTKYKTLKLLEYNTGENLDDLGFSKAFLDRTPKAQSMKEIIDNSDFIKRLWSERNNGEKVKK